MDYCKQCGKELGNKIWWAKIRNKTYPYCSLAHTPKSTDDVAVECISTLADIIEKEKIATGTNES